MKTKYKGTESRRKTPWDDIAEPTPLQQMIKNRYLDAYHARHPEIGNSNEITFLNSIRVESCRCCASPNIQLFGHTRTGLQRFFCCDCKHTFTVITNTLFENRKISITEWIEFCLDIFRYESLAVTSKTNKNSATTTKYWLAKLFILLDDYQNNLILSGKNVYIDETYYSVVESDKVKKDGKQLRGLSKNQYCIGIGFDGTHTIAIVEGTGKTSQKKTLEAFETHIGENSHLIHDKEKSHKKLVEKLSLTDEVYDAKECSKLPDKENPLTPINRQCFLLQKFLNSHPGFNRDDLQNYLNLFCYIINPPHSKLSKIEKLLIIAMDSNKSLKYRDFYKPKVK